MDSHHYLQTALVFLLATVIAVPLKQSGRIVGVLALYDKSPSDVEQTTDAQFTEHDLEALLTFVGQASVAVDNVLLHQEAQRLSLTDPLTGLWNYRYLTLALGHEIERATRFGRPLTVLELVVVLEERDRVVGELAQSLAELALPFDESSRRAARAAIARARRAC